MTDFLCADCGEPSAGAYRCPACTARHLEESRGWNEAEGGWKGTRHEAGAAEERSESSLGAGVAMWPQTTNVYDVAPDRAVAGQGRLLLCSGVALCLAGMVFFSVSGVTAVRWLCDGSARAAAGRTVEAAWALMLISLLFIAGLGMVLLNLEHRLRGRGPSARGWMMLKPSTRRLTLRPYSPTSAKVLSVISAVGALIMFISTIRCYSDVQRSDLTQHHGIAVASRVLSVNNEFHNYAKGGGGYYTATAILALDPPIKGHSTTMAHFAGRLDINPGLGIAALVDPNDPGYAELPGHPFKTTQNWVVFMVITLLFAGWFAYVARTWRRMEARQASSLGG